MGFRDKVSEAKNAAADTASNVKETASDKTKEAKETAADVKGTASDMASEAKETASVKVHSTQRRVKKSLPDQPVSTPDLKGMMGDRDIATSFASMSYTQFSSPDIQVRTAVSQYGSTATNVAREVDYEQSYRLGKSGLKCGKKYGDYVPVAGGFLPYIGLAAGVGLGVLDSVDLLSADNVTDFSTSVSDAATEVVQTDAENFSEDVTTGSVAFADSYFAEQDEEGIEDILEMDFDDFAKK